MKIAFMPIGIAAGLLAGQISKKVFDFVWGLVDDEEAPRPKHREIAFVKLVPALLVEGALFRVVRGLVDHGTRHGFARVTGTWPGEERPQPERHAPHASDSGSLVWDMHRAQQNRTGAR